MWRITVKNNQKTCFRCSVNGCAATDKVLIHSEGNINRRYNCNDNVVAESFFPLLKRKRTNGIFNRQDIQVRAHFNYT